MVWKSSCVVKSQTGCNQAMEYSKHSKTCSIITACGICPLCLEAKKKYMDSGPTSTEPLLEEGAASIFSCQLCAPLAKTQTTRTAIFWPMGLQTLLDTWFFMARNNKKSDNFNWRLGAAASFQAFVRYLCEFGLCGPQTQPKIAQLQSARWRACVRKVILLQRSCPCPS